MSDLSRKQFFRETLIKLEEIRAELEESEFNEYVDDEDKHEDENERFLSSLCELIDVTAQQL